MSFNLPPRPTTYLQYTYPRNGGRDRPHRTGLGSGYHAADKARYIHANYRFVVNPSGDYRAQAIDADVPLDWDSVLQILVSEESQQSQCPICLSKPVAPRMAKCGHIFCLPCLIRYMHATDDDETTAKRKRYKACPLCWDSIYMSDTRAVRWFTGQENPAPKEGEDVILRLVMRQPGGTFALPRDEAETMGKADEIPWYFAAEVTDYARIMKGTEDYMTAQYDTEIEELKQQEAEDELVYGDETTWTKKAVNAVKEAKEKIQGIGNAPPVSKSSGKKSKRQDPVAGPRMVEHVSIERTNTNDETVPAPDLSAAEMDIVKDAQPSPSPAAFNPNAAPFEIAQPILEPPAPFEPPTPIEPMPASLTQPQPAAQHAPRGHRRNPSTTSSAGQSAGPQPYYFYQALQHYYLAPLDIRILKSAFGSFSNFPSTLLPRVEHVSTGHIVDDELRRRTKYLSHLPSGCEVAFLECNWTDVVPPEVLKGFEGEIEKRRKRNREKETREEKARVRAERMEEEERWAGVRARRKEGFAKVEEEERFSAADFAPLGSHSVNSGGSEAGDGSGSPRYEPRTGSAFASLASPGTSPPGESGNASGKKTVWGTRVLDPLDEHDYVATSGGDDGWLLDWEKELRYGEDELLAQAQALSLADDGNARDGGSSAVAIPSGGAGGKAQGGKKKKGKKITLMSTTARRAA
jgi:hypothetical protein